MKTFKTFLKEAYFDIVKIGQEEYAEIFRNPSLSEFEELWATNPYSEVRGFISNTGDLYIWDVFQLHEDVLDRVEINGKKGHDNYLNIESGVAVQIRKRIVFLSTIVDDIKSKRKKIEEYFLKCEKKNKLLTFRMVSIPNQEI